MNQDEEIAALKVTVERLTSMLDLATEAIKEGLPALASLKPVEVDLRPKLEEAISDMVRAAEDLMADQPNFRACDKWAEAGLELQSTLDLVFASRPSPAPVVQSLTDEMLEAMYDEIIADFGKSRNTPGPMYLKFARAIERHLTAAATPPTPAHGKQEGET